MEFSEILRQLQKEFYKEKNKEKKEIFLNKLSKFIEKQTQINQTEFSKVMEEERILLEEHFETVFPKIEDRNLPGYTPDKSGVFQSFMLIILLAFLSPSHKSVDFPEDIITAFQANEYQPISYRIEQYSSISFSQFLLILNVMDSSKEYSHNYMELIKALFNKFKSDPFLSNRILEENEEMKILGDDVIKEKVIYYLAFCMYQVFTQEKDKELKNFKGKNLDAVRTKSDFSTICFMLRSFTMLFRAEFIDALHLVQQLNWQHEEDYDISKLQTLKYRISKEKNADIADHDFSKFAFDQMHIDFTSVRQEIIPIYDITEFRTKNKFGEDYATTLQER